MKPIFLLRLILPLCLALAVAPRFAAAETRVGAVFSTRAGSDGSQSFLRFYNAGTVTGRVTVVVRDFFDGTTLGQWISPEIPAGAEQQFDIAQVETGFPAPSGPRPYYYTLEMQASFPGYFQHVLWRSRDGTLTNLSTCSADITTVGSTLVGVHSSLLNNVNGFGYPSTVVVNNTGTQDAAVQLGIFDARNGTRLGSYTTATIKAGGAQAIMVSSMETAATSPGPGMYHYVIKAETPFTGFFEHLVDNQSTAVTTDMTNACAMNGAPTTGAAAPLRIGAVFSTAQSNSRSYLRFINTGDSPGFLTVTVRNQATGQIYGNWTSPAISPNSEQQFPIEVIEAAALGQAAKPPFYTMSIQTSMRGYFQHVLWRVADGTLTNLSTCNGGVTADTRNVGGVHSTILADRNFPSEVIVNNLGPETSVNVGVYDARDGTKRGAFNTSAIPTNGIFRMSSLLLEGMIGKSPGSDQTMYHYVVKLESPLNGFVQHLVNNLQAGVVTDMTIACAMNQ